MGDPMPTVISKGRAGQYFDGRFADADARWAMLQELRAIDDVMTLGPNGEDKLVEALLSGLATQNGTLYQFLRDGLTDWFDPAANLWNYYEIDDSSPNFTVIDEVADAQHANLNKARQVVLFGIIRALEVSLGLGIDGVQSPPVFTKSKWSWLNPLKDAFNSALKALSGSSTRGPLKLHWVCGKGDGFDVQVTWSETEVNCFIITPPIRLAIPDPPLPNSWQDPAGRAAIISAMTNDAAGMLVVTAPVAVGEVTAALPTTTLMHRTDGGITPA